ncbi:MAG: hypothetical protein PHO37_15050 [Kiritimatiellae bacterium]|nr:hypothetical protein [Kiritimatiellia bacterium]
MKKQLLTLIFASLISISLGSEKESVRDPFWPVGYQPPPLPGQEPPAVEPEPVKVEPEKPKPPPPKPVTSDDWKVARKLLKVNGYAVGQRQGGETERTTSVVIINLKHYNTGEKIKLTHDSIDFVWRVGAIENNTVELIQESAVRAEDGKKVAE